MSSLLALAGGLLAMLLLYAGVWCACWAVATRGAWGLIPMRPLHHDPFLPKPENQESIDAPEKV